MHSDTKVVPPERGALAVRPSERTHSIASAADSR
jgi:hypothetical protein